PPAFNVLVQHRPHADRKIARDPTADLKEASRRVFCVAAIPCRQCNHIFDSRAYGLEIADFARDAAGGVDVSEGRVLPTGNEHREILLGSSHHPTVDRVDLVELLELTVLQDLEKEFVRKKTLSFAGGSNSPFSCRLFDPGGGLFLGDTCVCDPVEMTPHQIFLRLRAQLPVIW